MNTDPDPTGRFTNTVYQCDLQPNRASFACKVLVPQSYVSRVPSSLSSQRKHQVSAPIFADAKWLSCIPALRCVEQLAFEDLRRPWEL